MLLQYMRSERFQNLFRPKAYSADTIPAGKHNKLPELNFKKNFAQMKIHDVTGKRSELKRVGDGCRATDEQFYVWNLRIYMPLARKKHALVHKRSEEKLVG